MVATAVVLALCGQQGQQAHWKEVLLLASYNATSINTMLMPLEALLVVLEPHLCPASPSASQAPLPEELPIHGSASGWPTGPQASGGQAQPAQESSTRRRPEAPNPSSVNATDLREAELALALLRMGLPGNMFERGAALQSDLQQRLVGVATGWPSSSGRFQF
ncbi:hypothetical protein HaLaN_11014 [Haematococcus lacustris]|uniref:Uncharacterized protein n=1 Tax=Haematococcus lacustris TaxID=44745 RepID=A0A699ZGZ9_HAELA|nr:hypothetical protein HaLaN_11014 [Haematococcus lacustris]